MPATQVRGAQVLDGSIQRADIDVSTAGKSVIRKAVEGAGIKLTSDGADAGTGDVTISLDTTIPASVTTVYIGDKARLIALPNGVSLEVQDSGAVWRKQAEWIES